MKKSLFLEEKTENFFIKNWLFSLKKRKISNYIHLQKFVKKFQKRWILYEFFVKISLISTFTNQNFKVIHGFPYQEFPTKFVWKKTIFQSKNWLNFFFQNIFKEISKYFQNHFLELKWSFLFKLWRKVDFFGKG